MVYIGSLRLHATYELRDLSTLNQMLLSPLSTTSLFPQKLMDFDS